MTLESVRAIDVVPYRWALWCSIEAGEPFDNPIVHASWSSDGRIWWGLDSHNAFLVEPDAIVELVRLVGHWEPQDADERHAEFLARRPEVKP